jgi:hypothetical protein
MERGQGRGLEGGQGVRVERGWRHGMMDFEIAF